MTLSQVQNYRVGQVPNRAKALRNGDIASKTFPAPTAIKTVTVGGTATTGTYSYTVDGTTVSYAADTGAGDTNATIAAGLLAAAQSNDLGIYDDINVSLSGLVLTHAERIPGEGFTLAGATAPGSGTLTIATVDDGTESDLPLGVGVTLVSGEPGQIRLPQSGDTGIFGVVTDQGSIRPNEGDPNISDGYKEGSSAGVLRKGLAVVQVEDTPSPGDKIYCRTETASGKQLGAFRKDSGGVNQVTRGDVVFNSTDTVGLAVDSLPDLTVASDTSDDITATALRDAWNASAQHWAVATASVDLSGAESYIILTFKDFAEHTVAAVSPATADVTGITNTTAAVAAQAVLVPGEFVEFISTGVAIADFNLPS